MITLKLTDNKVINELKMTIDDLKTAYNNSTNSTTDLKIYKSIARLETIINLSQED